MKKVVLNEVEEISISALPEIPLIGFLTKSNTKYFLVRIEKNKFCSCGGANVQFDCMDRRISESAKEHIDLAISYGDTVFEFETLSEIYTWLSDAI